MQGRAAKRTVQTAIWFLAICSIVALFAVPGVEHTSTLLPLTLMGLVLIGLAVGVQRMWWTLLLVPVMLWPISGWLLLQIYLLLAPDEPLKLSF